MNQVGVQQPFPPYEYGYAGAGVGIEQPFPPREYGMSIAGRRRRRRRRRRRPKLKIRTARRAPKRAKIAPARMAIRRPGTGTRNVGDCYGDWVGNEWLTCCVLPDGDELCQGPIAGAKHKNNGSKKRKKRNSADAIKNGIAAGYRTLPSQIYGQVLPPKGYAGQNANGGQWYPVGRAPGHVSLSTEGDMGFLHHGGGKKSYVQIRAHQNGQVYVVPAAYRPARFVPIAGAMNRPVFPSYPGNTGFMGTHNSHNNGCPPNGNNNGNNNHAATTNGPNGRTAHGGPNGNKNAHGHMGAMVPPAFPSYPGNTGFMGAAKACDGNCGSACTCK